MWTNITSGLDVWGLPWLPWVSRVWACVHWVRCAGLNNSCECLAGLVPLIRSRLSSQNHTQSQRYRLEWNIKDLLSLSRERKERLST